MPRKIYAEKDKTQELRDIDLGVFRDNCLRNPRAAPVANAQNKAATLYSIASLSQPLYFLKHADRFFQIHLYPERRFHKADQRILLLKVPAILCSSRPMRC